jgi:hypothetical protein
VRAELEENYMWDPEPVVGDRPMIVYDPRDPEYHVADVRYELSLLDAWVPLMAAAAMTIVWVLAWRGRLRSLLDP